jgi:elongation factor Ts
MSISAQDVKELRDATGVGMMDCKKALEEADGDFDEAIELLRKKGEEVVDKRSDRKAEEGLVVTSIAADQRLGAIAEVNCETDFVARNDDFSSFADRVAELVLQERPDDLDALHALDYNGEHTVEEELVRMTGRIGEKLAIRRFEILEASDDGHIVSYIHPGSKLGVLVDVTGDDEQAPLDVAMQIAALNPVAVSRDEVPESVQEKEKEIARESAISDGKPEHVIENIVNGKLNRYFQDNVLLEQDFVKDASTSVQDMLDEADVSVHGFVRYALGN